MAKADAKVKIGDEEMSFSNFEMLAKEVELLKEVVEECVRILREHNLTRTEIIQAPYFDEDTLFNELDEEHSDTKRD